MADLHLGELVDPASHQRDGNAVTLDTADFTTHGVIVGMTGSGKTGLGDRAPRGGLVGGVPCLLIDPKGDLTNLPSLFPNLAPPTSGRGSTRARPSRPAVTRTSSPASQAQAWKDGLAGWGIGPERVAALRDGVDVTIYTPGSTSGVPINIVGSLQAPADVSDLETMRDEIDGLRLGPARSGRDRRRSAVVARAHPSRQPDRDELDGRPQPRPRHARRPGPDPADPQARRVRARPVLPAEGPD